MLALALALLATPAAAMELTHDVEAGDQRLLMGMASEPLFTASLGYARGVAVRGHDLTVAGSVTLPLHLMDGRHQRVELSARATLAEWRGLRLDARLGLGEQSTRSHLFSGVSLTTRATLVGGWFPERGFIALEATTQWNPATWMAPSSFYLDAVHPEAQAGWYASTAAYQTFALQGGVVVRERLEIGARVGVDTTLRGGSRTAPVAMGLGVGWRL